jgi:hypothetical protein
LLERSKVCNLGRKPSSGGILPEMLLFCNDTCRRFVRFPIDSDKPPERDWLGAPLPLRDRERNCRH